MKVNMITTVSMNIPRSDINGCPSENKNEFLITSNQFNW